MKNNIISVEEMQESFENVRKTSNMVSWTTLGVVSVKRFWNCSNCGVAHEGDHDVDRCRRERKGVGL